jgi:hypothetical protein
VLLQHSAMHTPHVLCRLLCTSRGVRASVLLLCRGTLEVSPGATGQGVPLMRSQGAVFNSLLRFLPRHAALVQALDLQRVGYFYEPAAQAVQAVLTRALWEAKGSLCLQSLTVPLSCPALYQQVAAIANCRSHLTRLVVHANDREWPELIFCLCLLFLPNMVMSAFAWHGLNRGPFCLEAGWS